MASFERLDVSSWPFAEEEPAGRSEKVWLRDPEGTGSAETRWLFKPVTVHSNGSVQLGDVAEKVASEIAAQLQIPSAEVQLADRNGRHGSLSRNVRSKGFEMHSGHVWMSANPEVAFPGIGWVNSGRALAGYTIDNVLASIRELGPPPGTSVELAAHGAPGVFASYLALDAIIANGDRHENNWGILRPIVGADESLLAPAFDNENSLGYQLTDANKESILAGNKSGGVKGWALRGKAVRFQQDHEPIDDLVVFAVAAMLKTGTADFWAQKFANSEATLVEEIVDAIPQMSAAARTFMIKLTNTNIERLTNAIRDASP